jgi:hypothetical protein
VGRYEDPLVGSMDPTFDTSISFFGAHAIPDSQFSEIDVSTKLAIMIIKRYFMFYFAFVVLFVLLM